ncbi:tRNA (adenine(58)-N(1))-methyltransferase [Haematococcus lacustris]|uniref:tRNA (adenine(58)-N(1))-methyltransferase n=1 Tax=Haematococcus lacustris TaxID=44745 RepID=A0A699YMT2_HAELA|nr:tRNA (adenine(58)-N(1))-methyltransferase [Haematococcus lacustris]
MHLSYPNLDNIIPIATMDWLGLPFGSKVHARSGVRGWVHLLAPSPTLWSLVLPHRTQILYIADISMVCLHLDLAPGCVVLESGTGSASLTHSLVRAVAPLGHVHTFEFHSGRAEQQPGQQPEQQPGQQPEQQPEQQPGQQPDQSPQQHDGDLPAGAAEAVEAVEVDLTGQADAVFLDLPAPQKLDG